MKKRILALILSLCMCLSLCTEALAVTITTETAQIGEITFSRKSITETQKAMSISGPKIRQAIESDMATFSEHGVPIFDHVDVGYRDGMLTYTFDIPDVDVSSTVSVDDTVTGQVTFYISEEDCYDVLTMKDDGTIYLNGSLVTFETEISEDTPSYLTSSSTQGARARYDEYSSNDYCPGATYIKDGSQVTQHINSENYIKHITITALATLIGAAIGGIPGTVAKLLFSSIAGEIKTTAEYYCPSSKAVACKLQKYSKSPQGTIDMYYKYVGTYYADTSCSSTSYAGTSAYYRHNYFS